MQKIFIMLVAITIAASVHAIPAYINYQGTLLNDSGVPVTQNNVPVVISIWDHATNTAAANKKYQESHTVNVDDGNFSFAIGSGSSPVGTYNAALFDTAGERYLQLNVNGEDMLPRVRFLSAPFTLQSQNTQTLGNFPPAYFASASALAALQNQVNNLQIPSAENMCRATFGAVWIASQNFCLGGSVDASDHDFNKEDLTGVHLRNAKLIKTNLSQTQLRNACIFNTSFSPETLFGDANFFGSAVVGASFENINLKTTFLSGLYTDGITECPAQGDLPEAWECIPVTEAPKTYRLVGPGVSFSARCDLPAAKWEGVTLPGALLGADFSHNLFRNCTLQGGTNFKDANLYGAKFIGCSVYSPIVFNNTTCPDGTNSDDTSNDGTCFGHGVPTPNK